MMAKPWDEYREAIIKLYIQEGRTLEDVRNIMKMRYNFEASIRSYRQHFDKWKVTKYNCKKRQRRRQPLDKNAPLSPPHSPSDPVVKTEESTLSASSSRRSSEQKPLPALDQPLRYSAYFHEQARARDDLQVKMERSRGPLWESAAMFRSPQVANGIVPSCVYPLASWAPLG
ncbi:hypothetical protein F66182_6270 [Fusarium sp. NRRL 66182]|nr:hypothetical protein F66182_6270 [Fusarium sp. NRRL 66182]